MNLLGFPYDKGMTTNELRVLGTNDEQTECDKCGRMELRGTVVIADMDGAEIGRYGTTCAGRILGYSITRHDATNAEAYRRQNIAHELRAALKAHKAGDTAAVAWRIEEARAIGVIRKDEKALIAKLES